MRLGLITALLVVVSDALGGGHITKTVGHGVSQLGRKMLSKPGAASDLSETLCGTTSILLAGHMFDSVMEDSHEVATRSLAVDQVLRL